MKKIILTCAAILAAAMSLSAQEYKYSPKKGDWSIGITFNPVSLKSSTKYQPATGDFSGAYIEELGKSPRQMYFLSKDPLAAFNVKYRLKENWSVKGSLGLNGSRVHYREYVRDDIAFAADPKSENKVTDVVNSSMDYLALGLGLEYSKGFGDFFFTAGFGLQYALGGGSMSFEYGNSFDAGRPAPSTMPLSGTTLNDNPNLTALGVAWARPVERKNVGVNTGIGLTCDMGIEWFFAGNVSISGAVTFTPIMLATQSQTYSTFEGWSTTANGVVQYNNLVSPGSSAFLYGTENLGFRLALNYYL